MPEILPAEPYYVAPDTWIVPTFASAEGAWVGVHSMVIRGAEPVIVDTGAPLVRDQWLAQVTSIVDPADVRWVFLSHDDHDHVGNLMTVLDLCPNAVLVANFAIVGRLAGDLELPMQRMRWLDPGDAFAAGDRTLQLVRPPMFDSPATRGLFDTSTGMLWAVDSFGSLVHDAVFERSDVPDDLYEGTFDVLNSWNTPWMEWLDVDRYAAHVSTTRSLAPSVVASAHGPVLRGAAIADAFDRTLALAARPPIPMPGQEALDLMLAAALVGEGVAA